MKKCGLTLLVCVFCLSAAVAQDTLYKRNGDIIITKILEVNPEIVKYKNFSFLEGPIYSVAKSELFMIRYQNGLKDIFLEEQSKPNDDYATDKKTSKPTKFSLGEITDNPISIDGYSYSIGYLNLHPKKVDQLLLNKNDKQISLMIHTAQNNKVTSRILSFAPIPLGIGAYATLLSGSLSSYNANATNYLTLAGVFTAAAIGTAITATVLNVKSKKLRSRAVALYNLKYYNYK